MLSMVLLLWSLVCGWPVDWVLSEGVERQRVGWLKNMTSYTEEYHWLDHGYDREME